MSDRPRLVAVLDVGKTNVKLVVHDLDAGADLFVRARPNAVVQAAPYPHYDTEGIWAFFLEALAEAGRQHRIDAISVTTHGASLALMAGDRLAMPVLDYEFLGPDGLAAEYASVRPPFAESFAPRLPGGLNAGAQLFWQQRTFPESFATVTDVLPYPQYWAYRLSGRKASEATSLGCHTDLWAPREGRLSTMVARLGWTGLFPELRSAFDVLGPITPAVAAATGLPGDTPVHCGLHDSNASLLPHLLMRPAPFAVLSTGTWVIAFAVGGTLDGLDPGCDGLSNVDAFGRAVPSARFMGGREFELLTEGVKAPPTTEDIRSVLRSKAMVLPTLTPGSGPYGARKGGWTIDPAALTPGERVAAVDLYLALVARQCLAVAGADGPTVIEGPFGRNGLFAAALVVLTERPVEIALGTTGTSTGAAMLARPRDQIVKLEAVAAPEPEFDPALLYDYAEDWHRRL
ncbi:FGGY-family carbohydrate kinase [Oryzibacter oryziterrae]|uniref:FGGY-family carbohydrate kinase n=1 Tax=Oryzibacter oryziterrae TaxID=2766474 RepID=UPI001F319F51|nr:FGGY-family carbohydrate kinase [Oryzibacter oryziterrae]